MGKEKYLSIKIVGHDYIKVFRNKDKTAPNQPDFKTNGVAVWVLEYDEKPKINTEQEMVLDNGI
jgi:hypothetical protein